MLVANWRSISHILTAWEAQGLRNQSLRGDQATLQDLSVLAMFVLKGITLTAVPSCSLSLHSPALVWKDQITFPPLRHCPPQWPHWQWAGVWYSCTAGFSAHRCLLPGAKGEEFACICHCAQRMGTMLATNTDQTWGPGLPLRSAFPGCHQSASQEADHDSHLKEKDDFRREAKVC